MNEEMFKKIESGKAKYKFDEVLMLTSVLGHVARNQIYLIHIINELYPKEKERKKVFSRLDAEADKYAFQVLAQLADYSEKLSDSSK